ncbi:DNA-binding CsgD family transcriptional regulator [Mesonia hippocampi]|uniref:DNA-binding CsgD family transcriptional regulator n=1 Tax=Mesonia hippocampi TaxID=1628250 RepID=A0A840EQF3_9FLAO|nr:LuxR C-terminal-related transcriptional regulator [Mesonia hippocampi]MBB4119285.1 DNA-binding CsgD family transcriptional regulator [Mesonia hippocampi]
MRILIPFLLFFNCNLLAQDYTTILHKKRADRFMFFRNNFHINTKLLNDSTAYFHEVNKLLQLAIKENDKELAMEAEFLKYDFLSSRNYPDFLTEVNDFKDRIDKEGIQHFQARIRQLLGYYYFFETRQYEKAIENFSQSYSYITDLSPDVFPDKQEAIYNIAYIYYEIGYKETALEYLKIAEKLSNTYYPQLPLSIDNTKGMIMEFKGQLDSSLIYYTKVYNLAEENKFPTWKRIAENSIARVYFSQKKYNKILELFQEEINLLNPDRDINVKINRYEMLAYTYIALGKEKEAIASIDTLEKHLEGRNTRWMDLKKVLPLKAYSHQKKGHYKEAYKLLDSALNFTNLDNKLKNAELLKQADQKENIERHLRQQQEIKNQKKINFISRIASLIIISLIALIVYVLIQKQKTTYKNKQMKLELRNREISKKLTASEARLKQFRNFLYTKNKEIQAYRNELESLDKTTENSKEVTERKKKLNKLLEKAMLTDESWLEFKKAFTESHPDFLKNLQHEIPTLTPSEIRYIVLLKLGLEAKEIASILGIQPSSIRIYKYRIRKKVNANDDAFLEKKIFNL